MLGPGPVILHSSFCILHSALRRPAWLSNDRSSFVHRRANHSTKLRVSPLPPHSNEKCTVKNPKLSGTIGLQTFCILHSTFCIYTAPVAQLPERDASNVGDAGETPAGSANFTGMWFNPNSRGSRFRIWQPWGCKSLHAHHFPATGFSGNSRPRRLKIAEPSGCKSRVADQFLPPGFGPAGRRVVDREQQTGSAQTRTALGVQVSPRRPFLECQPDKRAGPRC